MSSVNWRPIHGSPSVPRATPAGLPVGRAIRLASGILPHHDRTPNPVAVWVMACRPKTLPVAMAPVVVGTAVARAAGGIRWLPAFAALVGALLLQIAANLVNDVFDHEQGADNEDRLGPTRVVQAGLLSASRVRIGVAVALTLALLDGSYLAWVGGWPIVGLGLAAMVCSVAYTAGPYPLGYHGLGEIFVLVFFGFGGVLGTVYVQTGTVTSLAWWLSVPVGALAAAVLVVNNLRDLSTDATAGKRTLAVRLGRRGAVVEYWLLIGAAYAVPPGLVFLLGAPVWVALPVITLPLGLGLAARVSRETGRPLNRALAQTAVLLLLYALMISIGLLLGTGVP